MLLFTRIEQERHLARVLKNIGDSLEAQNGFGELCAKWFWWNHGIVRALDMARGVAKLLTIRNLKTV